MDGWIDRWVHRQKAIRMVRPIQVAVLLFSVNPLPGKHSLPLPPQLTGPLTLLPLPQLSDCFYQGGDEGCAPLLVSLVTNEPT